MTSSREGIICAPTPRKLNAAIAFANRAAFTAETVLSVALMKKLGRENIAGAREILGFDLVTRQLLVLAREHHA